MKKIFLAFLATFSLSFLNAQDVILEETVLDSLTDPTEELFGKSFGASVALGFPLGPAPGAGGKVESFRSPMFTFSFNFKNRFNKIFGVTAALKYSNEQYRIDQNAIDKQSVIFNNFGLAAGFRLYGGTGKLKKNFLELGGYGEYLAGSRVESENDILIQNDPVMNIDPSISKDHLFVERNLSITNDVLYGVHAKIASGTFALYGKYRLADYFNNNSTFNEFPRLIAGIEFGF